MGLFLLSVSYTAPIPEVEKAFDLHVAWLMERYARGDYLSFAKKVPATGGICTATASSLAEMERIISSDPFVVKGVARYDIQEIALTKMSPKLLEHAELTE
jgi:uncharacterized protein YciI